MEAVEVQTDWSELAEAVVELGNALTHGGASAEQVRQLAALVRGLAGIEVQQD